jgi:hypothetical protein
MEPAHDGLQYAALPGEYQTAARNPENRLFDIFRSIWSTPPATDDDEMGDFIDQFGEAQSSRRRQRMSDELKKVRERR